MDFEMSHFGENPNSNWKIYGSGFLNRKRSDPDPDPHPYPYPHPDQQQPFKAARPDSYNNTMSLFSSYQTPPAYIGNRGLFTPSQWMELQQQALIYKHIVANVPVPSLLINHIKKSLDPFMFSGSASTSNATNLYGWGGFRLGFSASNDPEPGRCRRTDGKKWRCSKEAVPDQKYCEKHINRGRHRSRKLVEGKNGGGGDGDGGDGINNQFKNLQPQKTASAMNNRREEDNDGSNLIPVSWQNSIGGPLGEALRTCSSNGGNSNHHHSLSWCSYSPTGVFSCSNSSSASSPRDGGGDDMFSLSHANSASFQSSM